MKWKREEGRLYSSIMQGHGMPCPQKQILDMANSSLQSTTIYQRLRKRQTLVAHGNAIVHIRRRVTHFPKAPNHSTPPDWIGRQTKQRLYKHPCRIVVDDYYKTPVQTALIIKSFYSIVLLLRQVELFLHQNYFFRKRSIQWEERLSLEKLAS